MLLGNEEILAKALNSGLYSKEQGDWLELEPRLIQNNGFRKETVLDCIVDNLEKCTGFYWAVAFISEEALAMLKLTFAELQTRGIKGKLLTSNYLGFNQPKVYQELLKIKNLEVRIISAPLHVKGYGFHLGSWESFIIGSANLTGNALKCNFEWNIQLRGKPEGSFFQATLQAYQELYVQGEPLTETWLKAYAKEFREGSQVVASRNFTFNSEIIPNAMQGEALERIAYLRNKGANKGLLISATGTGKTFLAAFHIKAMEPKRMLFIAHREELLKQAITTFQRVIGGAAKDFGLLTGNSKEIHAKYLFATIQTLAKEDVLAKFREDDFPAIIFDEIHHGGGATYQRIWHYFKADFILGMTATPERRDGYNIYGLFDYNIIHEIRLQEALEEDLLCPFHYYGLQDFTSGEEIISEQTEFKKLIHEERVKHLLACSEYYGYSGRKLKGLAFCSTVAECEALAKLFREKGIEAVALSGGDKVEERQRLIRDLVDEEKALKYIFTVDIFNEGVDIPELNQIMLLRPTTSPVVFIQQLGRGLRKHPSKNYVTILDFIGNYENACNIPMALSGDNSHNKDGLRRYLAEGINYLPGLSTINFTSVAKEEIFRSLDQVRWDKLQLLQSQYRSLKEKIGRIPTMKDFLEYGTIDPRLYFTHKKAYYLAKGAPSYYGFIAAFDKDFNHYLNEVEERILGYLTSKFALGKRKIDLDLLNLLAKGKQVVVEGPKSLLENVGKLLHNEYNTTFKVTETYAGGEIADYQLVDQSSKSDLVVTNLVSNSVSNTKMAFLPTDDFRKALANPYFMDFFQQLLAYAMRENKLKYQALYLDTPFVYGGKYTYEEVCSLLNWQVNIPSLNIGGYKWDKETDTMPIFINYHTGSNYKRKIDYQHGFRDRKHFVCYSKPRRNLTSPEFVHLANFKAEKSAVYLFLRKNKDDTQTAKEFYFLGKMLPEELVEVNLPNDTSGVEMSFELMTPVAERLYSYLINP